MPVGRGSDSMIAPTYSLLFSRLGLDTCLFHGPSGSNWLSAFAPRFFVVLLTPKESLDVSPQCNCRVLMIALSQSFP